LLTGRPRVSVFTVAERTRFLDDCLESLCRQTFEDWDWVIVLPTTERWRPVFDDPRVRLIVEDSPLGPGARRRLACSVALGEFLVELRAGDILAHDALGLVVQAFDATSEIGFVYGDRGRSLDDAPGTLGDPDPALGWTVSDLTVDGRAVRVTEAMAPTPHNVSYPWYAPSQGRAWRRDLYEHCGGYDTNEDTLPDENLMCRMYQRTDFQHIPRCLYLRRPGSEVAGQDPDHDRLEHESLALYDRWIEPNTLAWARRRALLALDLAPPLDKASGYLGVGTTGAPGVEIDADGAHRLDVPDSSVGVIRAVEVLPYIPDKIALFNELYRVLAHGGLLLSLTPSADGRGAFQDPRANAFYNEHSFWYFTRADFARFVPEIECRFQESRLVTYFPSAWHKQHGIPYVCANLIAIKDGARQGGMLSAW